MSTPTPMTAARLAEIKRNAAEVAEYMSNGLMRDSSAYRDRADLLAEVERVRAIEAKVRDLHWRFDIYETCGCRDHEGKSVVTLVDGEEVCADCLQYSICHECCAPGDGQTEDCADNHDHTECWPCPTRKALDEPAQGRLADAGDRS